jgi:hypothetical protein
MSGVAKMSGFYKRKSKTHQWTDEEEEHLRTRKSEGADLSEIANELGLSLQQVESKVLSKKWRESLSATKPKPPQDAIEWDGGVYWRKPPHVTWHKGITGRLIHLSTIHTDIDSDG